jgi:hypothetical protein
MTSLLNDVPRHLHRQKKLEARGGKEEPVSVAIVRKLYDIQLELISNQGYKGKERKNRTMRPKDKRLMADVQNFFTPRHYDEVVEERGTKTVCAYPFCGNTVDESNCGGKPRNFKVSLRFGKIINTEGRHLFCSNYCFRTSGALRSTLSKVSPQTRNDLLALVRKERQDARDGADPVKVGESMLGSLRIVEKFPSGGGGMPAPPPILLKGDAHTLIDGYRATTSWTADDGASSSASRSQDDELVLVGFTTVKDTLFNKWYSDMTKAFLINQMRYPVPGEDLSLLTHQRREALASMLCPRAHDAAHIAGLDSIATSALEDDIRELIWTFNLNEPIPSLTGEQRVEIVVLLLKELKKAPWQTNQGTSYVENTKPGDEGDDWLDDSSEDERDRGRQRETRPKSPPRPGTDGSPSKPQIIYPNFIIEERPEEHVQVDNKLLPMPGRAGARPLGRKAKKRPKRSLRDHVDSTGNNSLAYSVLDD